MGSELGKSHKITTYFEMAEKTSKLPEEVGVVVDLIGAKRQAEVREV